MTGARSRILAIAVLVTAAAAIVVVLLGGGGPYVLKAQFLDASQMVRGGDVQIAGRKVGTVNAIRLSENGQAELELHLDDDRHTPLRQGTRAQVRTTGLSGVANRFVDLVPGPETAPEIPDGGELPHTRTRGVVDLDVLLNTLTPEVRKDVQGIIRDAAVALTPQTARQGNAGLRMLDPAVSELTQLGRELTLDEAALRSLLGHTASVSGVLARHRAELGSGLDATAGVLTAVASERDALADALEQAPGAMRATTATLRRLRSETLPAVDPVLRDARPAIGPLASVLRRSVPTLRDAAPVLDSIERLLPQARRELAALPRRQKAADPAIRSTTKALRDALPMVTGLRPYTPELVAGFFSGFGGAAAHPYDANGHYVRINFEAGAGALPALLPRPAGDQAGGYRTGVDARCPGAAEEPAPDRSNPWHEGARSTGGSCDPKDDHR